MNNHVQEIIEDLFDKKCDSDQAVRALEELITRAPNSRMEDVYIYVLQTLAELRERYTGKVQQVIIVCVALMLSERMRDYCLFIPIEKIDGNNFADPSFFDILLPLGKIADQFFADKLSVDTPFGEEMAFYSRFIYNICEEEQIEARKEKELQEANQAEQDVTPEPSAITSTPQEQEPPKDLYTDLPPCFRHPEEFAKKARAIFNDCTKAQLMEKNGERFIWKGHHILLDFLLGLMLGDKISRDRKPYWIINKEDRDGLKNPTEELTKYFNLQTKTGNSREALKERIGTSKSIPKHGGSQIIEIVGKYLEITTPQK